MLCYFHYMRIDFRSIVLKEDQEDTPSDYTLRIDGLRDIGNEWENVEIQRFFNNLFKGKDAVHVVAINRTFKISEYVRSKNKLERYKGKLKAMEQRYQNDEAHRKKEIDEKMKHYNNIVDDKAKTAEMKNIHKFEEVEKRIKDVEAIKIDQLKAKVKKHESRVEKFKERGLEYGSSVFVTFEYPEEAQKVVDEFNLGRLRRILLCKKRIKATRAPEPNEVIWENVGVPSRKKLKVRILGWGAFLVLIAASFGVILSLNYLQITTTDELGPDSPVVQALSITTSCLIMIVNFFLEQAFLKVSKYEKYSTYMDYFTEFTERLTLAQLLNTGFITLITKIMVRQSFKVDFFSPGGLLNQMNYVFLLNAVVQPSVELFDYNHILKKAQLILHQPKDKTNIVDVEQSQLNKLHEGTYFTLTQKYASLNKTVFLTCFYSTASPLLVLYSILGVIYKYWAEKFVFLRKSSKPNPMGYGLNKEMMEVFEWNAMLFSLGQVYVGLNLNDVAPAARGIIFAILAISVLNIYLPMETINEKLFPDSKIKKLSKDRVPEEERYVKPFSIQKFQIDYEIENLVTRKRALDRDSKLKGLGVCETKRIIENDQLKDPVFFASLDKYFMEAKLSSEILTSHKPPKRPQTSLEVVTSLIGSNRMKGLVDTLLRKVISEDDVKQTENSSRRDEDSHLDHTTQGNELLPPNTVESQKRERPTGIFPASFGRSLLKTYQIKTEQHDTDHSISLERQNSREVPASPNTGQGASMILKSPQVGIRSRGPMTMTNLSVITGDNKEKQKPAPPKKQVNKLGFLGSILNIAIPETKNENAEESARIKRKDSNNSKKPQRGLSKTVTDLSAIDTQPMLTQEGEGISTPSVAGPADSARFFSKRVPEVLLSPEEKAITIQIQEQAYQEVVGNLFSPQDKPILIKEDCLAEHPSILDVDPFADD